MLNFSFFLLTFFPASFLFPFVHFVMKSMNVSSSETESNKGRGNDDTFDSLGVLGGGSRR